MNIDWSSVEIRGQYPKSFNAVGFSHDWTGYEELIIERSHQKALDRSKNEKLMPRERVYKADFEPVPKDLDSIGLDRYPAIVGAGIGYVPRILDSYAETPPVIHGNDFRQYPELHVIAMMLRKARFLTDVIFCSGTSFGEEVLTFKFRNVEHGPPLAVEGVAQVKDLAEAKNRIQFFMDNIPDPAFRGYYPAYLWFVKQLMKLNPETKMIGSACTGPIASATFLRGPKEFLMDVRKNPELAELSLKAVSKYVMRKIERLNETLTTNAALLSRENPNGNELFFCDGGGAYLTYEEFTRTYDSHYGPVLDFCTKKGIPPYIAPLSPAKTAGLFIKYFDENLGGNLACDVGLPGFEDAMNLFNSADKTKDLVRVSAAGFGTADVLVGGKQLCKALLRCLRGHLSTEWKGLRVAATPSGGGNADVQTPLANLDELQRMGLELYKYPLKIPDWLIQQAEG
jgi:hypothetical protein